MLLPGTSADGALETAEKLRHALAQQRIEPVGHITASAGVGAYRRGEGREAFLRRIDAALYAAKAGGRDRATVSRDPARPAR